MRPWRIGISSDSRPMFASSIRSTTSRLPGEAFQFACELRGHSLRSFFPFARSSAWVAREELLASVSIEGLRMVSSAVVLACFDTPYYMGSDAERAHDLKDAHVLMHAALTLAMRRRYLSQPCIERHLYVCGVGRVSPCGLMPGGVTKQVEKAISREALATRAARTGEGKCGGFRVLVAKCASHNSPLNPAYFLSSCCSSGENLL